MAKYKLVSELHGSTYDTLIKYYPILTTLPIISKETFSTNPDDETEVDDFLIVNMDEDKFRAQDKLTALKAVIDIDAAKYNSSTCTYRGLKFDAPYTDADLQYERYNDIVIVFD